MIGFVEMRTSSSLLRILRATSCFRIQLETKILPYSKILYSLINSSGSSAWICKIHSYHVIIIDIFGIINVRLLNRMPFLHEDGTSHDKTQSNFDSIRILDGDAVQEVTQDFMNVGLVPAN